MIATYSVDPALRKKLFIVPPEPKTPLFSEPVSAVPTLTNTSISQVGNVISTKPRLITRAELENLGKDIKLVGYNPLDGLISNSNKIFTSKYKEPRCPDDRPRY